MRIARVAVVCAAVLAVGVVLVSGGSEAGPVTPKALPGLPPPFLGTAVAGEGGLTAAVDAYGDVVDLRAPGPAGKALIENPTDRQAAGTVPVKTGIVPRVTVGDSPPLPLWRAEVVSQHYLRDSNVVETRAFVKEARLIVRTAVTRDTLAMQLIPRSSRQGRALPAVSVNVTGGVHCAHEERAGVLDLLCRVGRALPPIHGSDSRRFFGVDDRTVHGAIGAARRWSRKARDLGPGAPAWAREMYRRSLLTIHALTSQKTGAVAAGAREGWAYAWPRDTAAAALALEASGHHADAVRVAGFLKSLDLTAAARFGEEGAPVPGRAAQGDALGWVDAAARATGVPPPDRPIPWRNRADYQESAPGTYLGNALAAANVDGPKSGDMERFSARQHWGAGAGMGVAREFGTGKGLVRVAGDPGSGLDSAAGWAVRPFGLRALYPTARKTLLRLVPDGTRYGITPGENWTGGDDPWMAPTAWSAWALAGLGDRSAALSLMSDLRRAATPAGDLPERVGVHTGIPTSTTPLVWPSAFAVLALRELWP